VYTGFCYISLMETEVYVRHTADCPHRDNPHTKKCRCRKWIYFPITRKRVSAATRSWEEAVRKARELENDALTPGSRRISEAAKQFLEDKEQQNISRNWLYKHRRELKQLTEFFAYQAARRLSEVTLEDLENFRKTWTGSSTTRSKRQERLRQFFSYGMKHGWCIRNVAADLSKIKVDEKPTLPLTRKQFDAALTAAAEYNPKAPDCEWRRQRATAMLLLCRHSGLRISDAARLERSKLQPNNALFLRTTKTGQSVYVPLPAKTAGLLRQLPNDNPQYFFWSGRTALESPGKRWWSTIKKIFHTAGVPESHPHCLRDTFAVESLEGGVDIKDVSVMLGHASIAITEKHYLPWVRSRQTHLEDSMRKMWERTGIA
jgi:integrase/recombinase XerD